jgi:APA family basic amino acid/polyamine antiporter
VAQPDRHFGTPSRAIAIQIGMASLLVLWGSFNQIISYFIFVAIAFLGITISTIFVIRRRQPHAENFILAVGYPITPLFYLAIVAFLLVLMLLHNWVQPMVGIAVVLAGWPAYSLLERKHARTTTVAKGVA